MPIINENPHEYDVTLFWAYEEEFDYSISHNGYETEEEYKTVSRMYDLAIKESICEENKVTSKKECNLYDDEKRTYYEMKREEYVDARFTNRGKWDFIRCLFFIDFTSETMYNIGFKYEEDYVYNFNEDKEDYKLLFIFKLRYLTPTNIIEFLSYQYMIQDFSIYPDDYRDFLATLLFEYDYMLSEKSVKTVKHYLANSYEEDKMRKKNSEGSSNNTNQNKESEFVESQSNPKYLKIPVKKVSRRKNDEITVLSQLETTLFINYLREINVFYSLNDERLNAINCAKALQVLTGFSHNKTRTELSSFSKNKSELVAIRRVLENLLKLIEKDLGKI